MNKEIPYKIYLEESEMPKQWYNVRADMKNKPAPILNPATLKPVTVDELSSIFCRELAMQELDETNAYIDIPQEIRDFYRMYRPSPLVRAYCLEKKLGTPAHIYYKFEGNNTSGSHKHNSACTGLLCKETGLERCNNRDRCRSVGNWHYLWHVHISTLTVRYIWLKYHTNRNHSEEKL